MTQPGWRVPDLNQTEPTADARTFARSVRQLYVALRQEGFGESQAIQIIGIGIAASIQSNQTQEGGDGDASA